MKRHILGVSLFGCSSGLTLLRGLMVFSLVESQMLFPVALKYATSFSPFSLV